MDTFVLIALLLTFIVQLLNWTTTYHAGLISKFFPNNAINEYAKLAKQRQELHTVNSKLSAQDDYAKWTKNNRNLSKLDKQLNDMSVKIKSLDANRSHILKRVKLVALTLPLIAIKLLHGKKIVYSMDDTTVFPQLVGGIWEKGFMSAALLPLHLWQNNFTLERKEGTVICLGIYLWALSNFLSNLEFIFETVVTKPITKPEAPISTTIETDLVELD